jgi:hypothetical protein
LVEFIGHLIYLAMISLPAKNVIVKSTLSDFGKNGQKVRRFIFEGIHITVDLTCLHYAG